MDNKTILTPDQVLPPLPASDPESIAKNRYNGFYGVGSRQYWKDAEVTLHKVQDPQACSHYFVSEGSQVMCTKCHAGYIGAGISAQDGKLIIRNNEVSF